MAAGTMVLEKLVVPIGMNASAYFRDAKRVLKSVDAMDKAFGRLRKSAAGGMGAGVKGAAEQIEKAAKAAKQLDAVQTRSAKTRKTQNRDEFNSFRRMEAAKRAARRADARASKETAADLRRGYAAHQRMEAAKRAARRADEVAGRKAYANQQRMNKAKEAGEKVRRRAEREQNAWGQRNLRTQVQFHRQRQREEERAQRRADREAEAWGQRNLRTQSQFHRQRQRDAERERRQGITQWRRQSRGSVGGRRNNRDAALAERIVGGSRSRGQAFEDRLGTFGRLRDQGFLSGDQYRSAVAAERTRFMERNAPRPPGGGGGGRGGGRRGSWSGTAGNLVRGGVGMSATITAPLTLGANEAIQAIAGYDRLRLAMDAMMGSADKAATEMEKLREVARLPGLGFKEAVHGSLQLQSVGIEADRARQILLAFGKAVALSGGGKTQLDLVITQLTQMHSAGKLIMQDFRPILQQAPIIGRAIVNAFGTRDIEALRQRGVTPDKLLDAIIREMEKFPPVTGGVANALENMQDTVFIALSRLEKAVGPMIMRFAEMVEGIDDLAKSFSNLPVPLQQTVIGMGAVAAATGPVLIALGSLGFAISGAGAALPYLTRAFNLLRAATVGGGLVTFFQVTLPGAIGTLAGAASTAIPALRAFWAVATGPVGIGLAAGSGILYLIDQMGLLGKKAEEVENQLARTMGIAEAGARGIGRTRANKLEAAGQDPAALAALKRDTEADMKRRQANAQSIEQNLIRQRNQLGAEETITPWTTALEGQIQANEQQLEIEQKAAKEAAAFLDLIDERGAAARKRSAANAPGKQDIQLAERLKEQTRTPEEQMRADVAEVNRLRQAGLIDRETAGRAIAQAQERAMTDQGKLDRDPAAEEMAREAERVWDRAATPLQKYNAELANLNRLYQAGAISQEIYTQGVRKARDVLEAPAVREAKRAQKQEEQNARAEMREAERVRVSTLNPQEKHQERTAYIQELAGVGAISPETAQRAVAQSERDMMKKMSPRKRAASRARSRINAGSGSRRRSGPIGFPFGGGRTAPLGGFGRRFDPKAAAGRRTARADRSAGRRAAAAKVAEQVRIRQAAEIAKRMNDPGFVGPKQPFGGRWQKPVAAAPDVPSHLLPPSMDDFTPRREAMRPPTKPTATVTEAGRGSAPGGEEQNVDYMAQIAENTAPLRNLKGGNTIAVANLRVP